MRRQLLLSVGLLAASALVWLFGWRMSAGHGLAVAVVLSSPLVAVALAPLVAPLLGASFRAVTEVAYRDMQGDYFAYKGHRVRIQEDLFGKSLGAGSGHPGPGAGFPRRRAR